MGKDCKFVGVNKPATTGGYYKSLGVNKPATAGGGKSKGTDGWNGKRSGGGKGSAMSVAGARAGGALVLSPTDHSTFKYQTAQKVATKTTTRGRTEVRMRYSPTDHSTAVTVTNEYYHKEENHYSLKDTAFSSVDHGTVGMAVVKVMDDYYD